MRKSAAAAAIAGSMLVGGGIGVALFAPNLAGADTTPPTATAPSGSNAAPAGPTPQGNEETTHEAAETPQREADEKAGKVANGARGPHMGAPNETDAHEKGEDPAREAAEDAAKAAAGSTTTTGPA
jgi:hypothetical protein